MKYLIIGDSMELPTRAQLQDILSSIDGVAVVMLQHQVDNEDLDQTRTVWACFEGHERVNVPKALHCFPDILVNRFDGEDKYPQEFVEDSVAMELRQHRTCGNQELDEEWLLYHDAEIWHSYQNGAPELLTSTDELVQLNKDEWLQYYKNFESNHVGE